MLKDAHECFLGGVLRELPVAERSVTVGDGHILKTSDDRFVGALIAQLDLGNKAG